MNRTGPVPAWFVAVAVPADLREQIAEAVAPLLPASCVQVDADKYHITLLYLGRVDPGDRHRCIEACRTVAAGTSHFPIELRGLHTFRTARVAVAGVSTGADRLRALWRSLHEKTLGVGSSTRIHPGQTEPTFEPHLTVGRFPPHVQADEIPETLDPGWTGTRFRVDTIELLASVAGAYDSVSTFDLA